jgi:hypothetical protein
MKISERWCERDLIVDLPLHADEEDMLREFMRLRAGYPTWPSVRLNLPEAPEGRWSENNSPVTSDT